MALIVTTENINSNDPDQTAVKHLNFDGYLILVILAVKTNALK